MKDNSQDDAVEVQLSNGIRIKVSREFYEDCLFRQRVYLPAMQRIIDEVIAADVDRIDRELGGEP